MRRSLASTVCALAAALAAGCGVLLATDPDGEPPGGGAGGDAASDQVSAEGSTDGAPARCHALSFDGVGDYVEVQDAPGLDPTGPSTVEAWVRLARDEKSELHVVSHHDHGLERGYLLMLFGYGSVARDGGAAQLSASARYYDGNGHTQIGFGTSAPVLRGAWTHISVVYDGTILRNYVDGVPKGSRTPAVSPANADLADVLRIGRAVEGGFPFDGVIDEVRISKAARYGADAFVPPRRFETDADTVALWHFDEGEGDVAGDASGLHPGAIHGASWVEAPCR